MTGDHDDEAERQDLLRGNRSALGQLTRAQSWRGSPHSGWMTNTRGSWLVPVATVLVATGVSTAVPSAG
jgi:hypothetical protein